MPPPAFGEIGIGQTAAMNCDASTMRLSILQAFKDTDTNGSGTVEQEELNALFKKLQIDLKDGVNDPLVIFQHIDEDDSGHITEEEWSAAFEPAIFKATVVNRDAKMDFEDILKDTFNKLLEESRAERGLVIEAFMRAYEKVKGGFGTRFLSEKWRFAIFDAFFSVKRIDRSMEPWDYLKKSLEETVAMTLTSENWASEALDKKDKTTFSRTESVQKACEQVKDVSVITEFCQEWLNILIELEPRRAANAAGSST